MTEVAPGELQVIDVVADDLALARAQLDAGLAAVAEGNLRRRVARLEADGPAGLQEIDAARCLMAEALWRQQRPLAAGAVVTAIRPSSLERRRPIALLIEAEAAAAGGDPDRGAALVEQVVGQIGVDEAWRLRGGVPSRLSWPLPAALRPPTRRPAQPRVEAPLAASPQRTAGAHVRLEIARQAYVSDDVVEGDRELGVALRLDPAIAPDGVVLMEPTLGRQPATDRLLLYGDLLRAAGRELEASAVFDRAARS